MALCRHHIGPFLAQKVGKVLFGKLQPRRFRVLGSWRPTVADSTRGSLAGAAVGERASVLLGGRSTINVARLCRQQLKMRRRLKDPLGRGADDRIEASCFLGRGVAANCQLLQVQLLDYSDACVVDPAPSGDTHPTIGPPRHTFTNPRGYKVLTKQDQHMAGNAVYWRTWP